MTENENKYEAEGICAVCVDMGDGEVPCKGKPEDCIYAENENDENMEN